MTQETTKTSNWSDFQIKALRDMAAAGGNTFAFDADKLKKLTADTLFKGKTERMLIGKVKSLGLPYAKKGEKAATGAAPKDETAADIQKEIIALLNLDSDIKLLQKTGLHALREKVRGLITDNDAAYAEDEPATA